MMPEPSIAPNRSLKFRQIRFVYMIAICWVIGVLALGVWLTDFIPVPDPHFKYDDPDWPYFARSLSPDMPLATIAAPWLRWDVLWYMGLAQDGYSAANFTAFAPLYPTLVGVVEAISLGLLGGNVVLAGMIVSITCAALVTVGLHRLAWEHFNGGPAPVRVLVLILAFPTAFFLVIPYTEALYLALVIGLFLAAERQRWWLAGLLALLAVLARFHGLILFIPLGWMALRAVLAQPPAARLRTAIRTAPAVIGAPLGALLLVLFIRSQGLADPATMLDSGWGGSIALPHTIAIEYLSRVFSGQAEWYEIETGIAIVVMIGLLIAAARQALRGRMRGEYVLYAAATLLLSLSLPGIGPQYGSVFRHLLLLFPCFFVLAGLLKSRRLMSAVVIGMGLWQVVLILRFTHWIWVA